MLPRFEDLDPETSNLVESFLPASALEMVRLIGLQAALLLIEHFGGTEVHFIREKETCFPRDFLALAKVIGTEKAAILAREYPEADRMYVPRCLKAMNALRNREIMALADKMIREKSRWKVYIDLARQYGTSTRTIQGILNGKGGKRA
ncbi:MAG: hypothetical protein NFW16_11520 [Candidatus Accumulibacter sp.]|jgi:hypothetical protein|uniref:hypothetical protein n=1 Tax=Accumulibacter sp. TaxID=2053492 RepID=UPI00258A1A9A|nr:hypothetical protein [Accumulibacter sp.]MCM8622334.1 hypothetical protein [Accumulibacter sp.]